MLRQAPGTNCSPGAFWSCCVPLLCPPVLDTSSRSSLPLMLLLSRSACLSSSASRLFSLWRLAMLPVPPMPMPVAPRREPLSVLFCTGCETPAGAQRHQLTVFEVLLFRSTCLSSSASRLFSLWRLAMLLVPPMPMPVAPRRELSSVLFCTGCETPAGDQVHQITDLGSLLVMWGAELFDTFLALG